MKKGLGQPKKFNKYFHYCQSNSRSLMKRTTPIEYKIKNDLFDLVKVGDTIIANIYAGTLTKTAHLIQKITNGKIIGKYKHFFIIQEENKYSKTSVKINDLIDHTVWIDLLRRNDDILIKNNLVHRGKNNGLQLRREQMEVRH